MFKNLRLLPVLALLFAIATVAVGAQAVGNGSGSGAFGNGGGATGGSGIVAPSPQMGAFYRCCGTPPFGDALNTSAPTPNPYPTMNGSSIPNTLAYCNAPDASGNSIVSGYPLDPTKLTTILDLNASWVREDDSPFFIDNSHVGGGYSWGQFDATNCGLYLHNIQPSINVEMQSVEYNDSYGGFNPVEHQRYDTPAQFATYCTAIATHVHANYPNDHLYSIPGNELNSDYTSILGGAPPPPVVLATASPTGTLSNSTAENYEVTAIVNGVETLPSNPYYNTVTPTNGTLNLTWGPQAGETGGYKVYRLISGVYEYIAATAHGVLSYQDTGVSTSGATPPPTSTVNTTALEANWAAYTIPCYSAIKAVDPAAVIYGFEANMDPSLTPVASQFITDERANFACGPGTCYDGISLHLSLTYPIASANPGSCYNGSATVISCIGAVETAAGSTVPIMLGEFVQTFPGMVPDETTKDISIYAQLTLFDAQPQIKYINYANVDECGLYSSGYFENGCVINTNNVRLPSWYALRPFYGSQVQVALGTSGVPQNVPTPAVPTNPYLVQSNYNLCSAAASCSATLTSAPTGGLIAVSYGYSDSSGSSTMSCSYNGSTMTTAYNSGVVTLSPNFEGLLLAYAHYAAGVSTVTCILSTARQFSNLAIGEIHNTTTVTAYNNVCTTSDCVASLAHSNMTSPQHLAFGGAYYAASCGTNWTGVSNGSIDLACYGYDTSSSPMTATAFSGWPNVEGFMEFSP